MLMLILLFVVMTFAACQTQGTKGLQYEMLEDGTYCVSGYDGKNTKVTIPAKYNGIDITAIGEYAFAETDIQSVSGGKNLKLINSNAFDSCYMLKNIKLNEDITEIWSEAFASCTSLSTVTLPEELQYLGSGAFENCSSIKEITIPDSITRIDGYTFAGCSNLQTVQLSEVLSSIAAKAFWKCESLKEIKLPQTLTSIGAGAFSHCQALTSITIPSSVTSVGEDIFSNGLTVYVEGSTVGWSGSWNGSAYVVYLNQDNTTPDVNIKFGTYMAMESFAGIDVIMHYFYIDGNELIYMYESGALLIGKDYSYEIEGNVLHCTPVKGSDRNIDIIYDETTESLEWGSKVFFWTGEDKTDEYIFYN